MYVQKKTNNQMQKKAHKTDFALCITVFLLLALGIVMVLSASAPSALAETGKSYTYFERQLVFAGIGIVVMFVVSFFPYKKLLRYYKLIYIFSVLILLLVLVPNIGRTGGGAQRWIQIRNSFSTIGDYEDWTHYCFRRILYRVPR